MNKLFLNIFLILLYGCNSVTDHFESSKSEIPPLMKLEIRDYAIYTVPFFPKILEIDYLETEYGNNIGWIPPVDKTIKINENEFENIRDLLDKALHMPVRDSGIGPDGTYWILSSNMYQEVRYSIWTPEIDTEERGYTDLLALQAYLAKLGETK